jgi:hypothetical protein
VVVQRDFHHRPLVVCGNRRELSGPFAAAMFVALFGHDAFIQKVVDVDPHICSLRYLFGRVPFLAVASLSFEALDLAMLRGEGGLPELDAGGDVSEQWRLPSQVLMLPGLGGGVSNEEMMRAVGVRKRVLGLVASSDKFQGMSLWGMRSGGGGPTAALGGGGGVASPGGGPGQSAAFSKFAETAGASVREVDDSTVRSMLLRYHPVVNAAVDQCLEILRNTGASGQQAGGGVGGGGRRRGATEASEAGEGYAESCFGGSCFGDGYQQPNKRKKTAAAVESERIYNVLMASRFNLRERVSCEEDVSLASRKLLDIGFSNYVVQAIQCAYWWVANPTTSAMASAQKRAVRTMGERVNMRPTAKDLARMREDAQQQAGLVFGCAVGERVCNKEKDFVTQEEFYPKSWVVVDVDGQFSLVDMPVADVSHETRSTSLQNIRVFLMTHLNCVVTKRRSPQCVFCMAGFCVDLEDDDPDLRAIRELERCPTFPEVRQLGIWLVNRMTPVAVQPHLVCFKDGVYDLISSKFFGFEAAIRARGVAGVQQQVTLDELGGICATDYTAFAFVESSASRVLGYLCEREGESVSAVCGSGCVDVPGALVADVEAKTGGGGVKALPSSAPWWCRLIPVFCHLVDPEAFVKHQSANNVAAWLGLLGAIMVPRRYEHGGQVCDMYNMLLFLIGNSGAGKTVFSRFLKMLLTEAGAGERNTAGLFSDSGSRFAMSLFNTDRYRKLTICNEISTGTGGLLNRDAICKFADQEAQETEFKGSSTAGQVVIRSTLLMMGNHFPHANVGLLDTAPMRRIVCFDWGTPRELDASAERSFHAELPVILVLASFFYNRMRAVSRDNIFAALTGITSDDHYRDFLSLGLGAALCRAPCTAEDVSVKYVRLGRFFRWFGENVVPLPAGYVPDGTEAPADVDTLLKEWARYELLYYSNAKEVNKFMRRVWTLRQYRDAALCPHGHFASAHLEQLLISRFGERAEDVRAGLTRKVRYIGAGSMAEHAAISLRYENRGRNHKSGDSAMATDVYPSAFDVMMQHGRGGGGRRNKEDFDALFVGGGYAVPLPDTIGESLHDKSARLWEDVCYNKELEDEPEDGWVDAEGIRAVSFATGAVCVGRFEDSWRERDYTSDVLWRVER